MSTGKTSNEKRVLLLKQFKGTWPPTEIQIEVPGMNTSQQEESVTVIVMTSKNVSYSFN